MTNVKCIEPNLGLLLEGGELKLFNLIWGGWQTSQEQGTDFFTNFLLRRNTDGSIIPPSYPTEVELRTQVQSLEYDGVYFWSVQAINDTPYYPGWSIYQWEISQSTYALARRNFKLFPGFATAKALALEWYHFPLGSSIGVGDTKIKAAVDRKFILDRLLPGQKIRIGPNIHDEYWWATIKQIYPWPNDPYVEHWWYYIEFYEGAPTSFVADGAPEIDPTPYSCFVETRVWVFDSAGYLYELNPIDLSTINKTYSPIFLNVKSAAFTYVEGIPSINAQQLTQALVYVKDMAVYYLDVTEDMGNRIEEKAEFTYMMDDGGGIHTEQLYGSVNNIVSAQSLFRHYYDGGNSFIPVYELRIRNDDPEEYFGDNHPQLYLLQRDYRSDRNSSVQTYSDSYNYFTNTSGALPKMEKQPTFLILSVEPQELVNVGSYTAAQQAWLDANVPGGFASLQKNQIADCQVIILDDYLFPVGIVGIEDPPYWKWVDVNWSATGGVGSFLDGATTQTNSSGITTNRFEKNSSEMPFPAYITASTDDIEP